jgi:hypothetical protein
MKELYRGNDLVEISYIRACLEAAGIEHFLSDQYTSVMEGSINAIQRRIFVLEEDFDQALSVLKEGEDKV